MADVVNLLAWRLGARCRADRPKGIRELRHDAFVAFKAKADAAEAQAGAPERAVSFPATLPCRGVLAHGGRFLCPTCGKGFRAAGYLLNHEAHEHG